MNDDKPTQKPRSGILLSVLVTLLVIVAVFPKQQSRAAEEVDLVLLLAMDVSASVNITEFDLMRRGLASAISSPEIAQAINAGKIGAIALSVVQWSGFQEQQVMIDWVRLSNPVELQKYADLISKMPRRYKDGATDIGGALKFSRRMILAAPFETKRLVIDVAGDGPNNVNASPIAERDRTLKAGININGLVVLGDVFLLGDYYTQFIIGGDAAFVEKTQDFDGFKRAIHKKLLREIGSLMLF